MVVGGRVIVNNLQERASQDAAPEGYMSGAPQSQEIVHREGVITKIPGQQRLPRRS